MNLESEAHTPRVTAAPFTLANRWEQPKGLMRDKQNKENVVSV